MVYSENCPSVAGSDPSLSEGSPSCPWRLEYTDVQLCRMGQRTPLQKPLYLEGRESKEKEKGERREGGGFGRQVSMHAWRAGQGARKSEGGGHTKNSHLPEQAGLDPDRDAVEPEQAPLDHLPLLDGNARGGTAVWSHVAVPSPPLDHAHPGDPEVGLHAQEGLVVPVGAPPDHGRAAGVGGVGSLGPVQVDGQEGADHYDAVGRGEQYLGLGGGGRIGGGEGGVGPTRGVRGVGGGGGEVHILLTPRPSSSCCCCCCCCGCGCGCGCGATAATGLVLGVLPLEEVVPREGGQRSPGPHVGAGVLPGVERRRAVGAPDPDRGDVLDGRGILGPPQDVGHGVLLVPAEALEGEAVHREGGGRGGGSLLRLLLGGSGGGGGGGGAGAASVGRVLPPVEAARAVDGVAVAEEALLLLLLLLLLRGGKGQEGSQARGRGRGGGGGGGGGGGQRRPPDALAGMDEGEAHPARADGRGKARALALRTLLGGGPGGPVLPPAPGAAAQGTAAEGQVEGGAGGEPGEARRGGVQGDHAGAVGAALRGAAAGALVLVLVLPPRRRGEEHRLAVADVLAPDQHGDPGHSAGNGRGGAGGGEAVHGSPPLRPGHGPGHGPGPGPGLQALRRDGQACHGRARRVSAWEHLSARGLRLRFSPRADARRFPLRFGDGVISDEMR